MQPHNPMLDTYRMLIARVRDHVPAALGAADQAVKEVGRAKTQWKMIDKRLTEIDAEIVAFGEGVFATLTNGDLTEEAQRRRIDAAAAVTRATVDTAREDVRQRVESTVSALRALSFPVRSGTDATQEAALANIKTDLRMTLDPVDGGLEVINKLARLLERAIGDSDELTTWVLAATHWPADYMESRGLHEHTGLWPHEIDRILDALSTGERAAHRGLYRALSNPRTGLRTLDVVLAAPLSQVLNQAQDWALRIPPSEAVVSPFHEASA